MDRFRAGSKRSRSLAVDTMEFSYANPDHPRLKRWVIRTVEGLSGRRRILDLYETWKHSIIGTSDTIWSDLLRLINIRLDLQDSAWPPENLPAGPLVLIANHL